MANLTQIELPNGTTYDIEDAKKKGVYVVKGTHTTATVAWTGAIDVDALYDGLTIVYYLPISATSGSTQVTLNLTLSGGGTTGAIKCFYNASNLTRSYYPAGSNILMTYWSAGSISISGTPTTEARWIAGADYNANSWRNITIDGTQVYSTSTSSGALALISGTNVNIASDGGAPAKVTISATDTTYTFANGTNGFTVTPSGGSAQTVTVTPSITNNVTGSGTSGYLTKWNGANTVTNGPQLGGATNTYLRNDGTWATPDNTDTKVKQDNTTTSDWRKVIVGYQNNASPGTAVSSVTNVVYAQKDFEFQPSTGTLNATKYSVAQSATIQYNSTTQSLDFVFP